MRRFLLHWLIAAIALYGAVRLVPGITYDGGWQTLAVMALIVGLVNAILRPILTIMTCPLQILTLGLFTLVINGALLLFAARLAETFGVGFYVQGFVAAFWGALVISVASFLMNVLIADDEHEH